MPIDFTPCRLPPFAHQIEDAAAVYKHPYLFIASQMRTGKSKIVIDGAQFLYQDNLIDRLVIVTPEPVRSVWCHPEFGELKTHLFLSTNALITEYHSRIDQWQFGEDVPNRLKIIVTNYEYIRPYTDALGNENDEHLKRLLKYCNVKTLLVLDESSAITNHKSDQFKACLKLRRRCGRIILLNGTPFDTPKDLFAQGNILHPDILNCRFITHFKNRYANVSAVIKRGQELVMHGKTVTKIDSYRNLDDLQRRFAPYTIRRLQKDCKDMPPKLPAATVVSTMTEKTWKIYKEMRDDMIVSLSGGMASAAPEAITKFMRLSQITGGFLGGVEEAGLDDDLFAEVDETVDHTPVKKVIEIGHEKLDTVLFLVAQQKAKDPHVKIIVWVRFRHEVQRLLDAVKKKHPDMICSGLHGGQSKTARAYVKSLLKPESAPPDPVFVAGTLGTGSYGLDFTAAYTSINHSYSHSLLKFLQSGDRVYGPNQKMPIDYFDIIAVGPKGQKTYDSVVVAARRAKEDLATWVSSDWVKKLSEE